MKEEEEKIAQVFNATIYDKLFFSLYFLCKSREKNILHKSIKNFIWIHRRSCTYVTLYKILLNKLVILYILRGCLDKRA